MQHGCSVPKANASLLAHKAPRRKGRRRRRVVAGSTMRCQLYHYLLTTLCALSSHSSLLPVGTTPSPTSPAALALPPSHWHRTTASSRVWCGRDVAPAIMCATRSPRSSQPLSVRRIWQASSTDVAAPGSALFAGATSARHHRRAFSKLVRP